MGVALLGTCCLGSSCDLVRKLTGRPTSVEIERLRVQRLLAEKDSLEKSAKVAQDTIAVLTEKVEELQSQANGTVLSPAKMGGLFTTKLDYRYYVVVGAFRQRSFAEKLLTRCTDAGYTATLISFRNGFNAVGLSQTDDLNDALRSKKRIEGESFCPPDVWIMVNE